MKEETRSEPHVVPEELAAYLEAALSAKDQARIEEHLAACDECREEAVESFRTLRSGRRALPRRWLGMTLSAAAVLALVVGGTAIVQLTRTDTLRFRSDPSGLGPEQVANIQIVRPADGSTVSRDSVVFAWRVESVGTFYRFTLMDEAGDVLWRTSTSDTVVTPGSEVSLRPGVEYYWIVDALLAGGRTATTGVRSFRIGGAP